MTSTTLHHQGASDGADALVASLGDTILLRGVGEGVAAGDALGGVEGGEGPVEEFSSTTIDGGTPVRVDVLDRAAELDLNLFDPADHSSCRIGFVGKQGGVAVTAGMIDNGEKIVVAVPVTGPGRLAQIHVDLVQRGARVVGVGWVGTGLLGGEGTGGARRGAGNGGYLE